MQWINMHISNTKINNKKKKLSWKKTSMHDIFLLQPKLYTQKKKKKKKKKKISFLHLAIFKVEIGKKLKN